MNTKLKSFVASLAIAAAVAGAASTLVFNPSSALSQERVEVRSDASVEAPVHSPEMSHAQALAGAFKQVAKKLDSSVVQIDVTRRVMNTNSFGRQDLDLRQMFPDNNGDGQPDFPPGFRMPGFGDAEPQMQGEGSGFVVDYSNGYAFIATNNHVAAEANEIAVTFGDGRQVSGKDVTVVGADPRTDVAVLKVKIDDVQPVKWGNSDNMERGDIVLAFGSPFGYAGSVSQGIISAKGREVGILRGRQGFENFIQTDAAINPGNSGGPLVNLAGEVIGINTAIASRTGGFNGIGFAIPSNQAKDIVERLRKDGRVVRGFLGVRISDIEVDPAAKETATSLGYTGKHGVLVSGVTAGSPAIDRLEPGDIITEYNGKPVTSMRELREMIAATAPKTEVTMKVWRGDGFHDVKLTLGEAPEEFANASTIRVPSQQQPPAIRLGVSVEEFDADMAEELRVPQNTKGLVIEDVVEGSIAQQIGLAQGDVITEINNKPITSRAELTAALTPESMKAGLRIVVVNKEGKKLVPYRQE
jgi:serine protease Do